MFLSKPEETDASAKDRWQYDVLGRELISQRLSKLIETISQPFVISISSNYGSGKTFFLRRFRQDLIESGFATVYFDAWASDFSRDPLAAFMTELTNQLSEVVGDDNEETKKLLKKGADFLLKRALPLGVGIGARLLLNYAGIREIELDEKFADLAEKTTAVAVESHIRDFELISGFKDQLAKVADAVEQSESTKQKQIVVLIDELDRCRTDFVIEFLEAIKHLFDVENYIFIVATDDGALKAAVNARWGSAVEGEVYLRKFIDWQFRLPDPDRTSYAFQLVERFRLIKEVDALTADNDFVSGVECLAEAFAVTSTAYKLSLREMDQCFTALNLALRLADEDNELPFVAQLAVLSVIRSKDSVTYLDICRRNYVPEIKFEEHRSPEAKKADDSRLISDIIELGAFSTGEKVEAWSDGLNRDLSRLPSPRPGIEDVQLQRNYQRLNASRARFDRIVEAAYGWSRGYREVRTNLDPVNQRIFNRLEAASVFMAG